MLHLLYSVSSNSYSYLCLYQNLVFMSVLEFKQLYSEAFTHFSSPSFSFTCKDVCQFSASSQWELSLANGWAGRFSALSEPIQPYKDGLGSFECRSVLSCQLRSFYQTYSSLLTFSSLVWFCFSLLKLIEYSFWTLQKHKVMIQTFPIL